MSLSFSGILSGSSVVAQLLIKVGNLGTTESLKYRVFERRVACEPAVEDEEAGAIAEDERTEDCLINYL